MNPCRHIFKKDTLAHDFPYFCNKKKEKKPGKKTHESHNLLRFRALRRKKKKQWYACVHQTQRRWHKTTDKNSPWGLCMRIWECSCWISCVVTTLLTGADTGADLVTSDITPLGGEMDRRRGGDGDLRLGDSDLLRGEEDRRRMRSRCVCVCLCVCVFVCVWQRSSAWRGGSSADAVTLCLCVCVCVWESVLLRGDEDRRRV
jgi:hypothetical protein